MKPSMNELFNREREIFNNLTYLGKPYGKRDITYRFSNDTEGDIENILRNPNSHMSLKKNVKESSKSLILKSRKDSIIINWFLKNITSLIFINISFPSEIIQYITGLYYRLKRPYYIFQINLKCEDKECPFNKNKECPFNKRKENHKRSFRFPIESTIEEVYKELAKWKWFDSSRDFIIIGKKIRWKKIKFNF
jgi:hypothetical protein